MAFETRTFDSKHPVSNSDYIAWAELKRPDAVWLHYRRKTSVSTSDSGSRTAAL